MSAFIKAISYYLPGRVLNNHELVTEFPEWTVEKVASKVGISERHISAPDETATDMAVKAAEKLFAEHSEIKCAEIDFVMLCTQSPDYFLPTSACMIQDRLGLNTHCGALDFNLGCSGYVYGLSLSKGLLAAGIARNVLLLTSETYTKYIHFKDKGNRTIFADAASATLISGNGFAEIGDFSLGTDGRGADNLIVRSGCARYPKPFGDIVYDENGNPVSSDHLYMNGSEIFNFTLETVPVLVADILVKNNVAQNDIDLFVFHQANKYMMNFLRRKLKIEEDKFYYSLDKFGNTVSSTIPIALKEAAREHKLDGKVLLAGFGVGYSWGGVVLTVNSRRL